MSVSPSVVIMTETELAAYADRSFQKGVERGRLEQRCDESRAKEPEANAGSAGPDPLTRPAMGSSRPVSGRSETATSERMDVTAGETAPNRAALLVEALEFYADPFAWKEKHDPEDLVRIPDFYSELSFGGAAAEALTAAKGSTGEG